MTASGPPSKPSGGRRGLSEQILGPAAGGVVLEKDGDAFRLTTSSPTRRSDGQRPQRGDGSIDEVRARGKRAPQVVRYAASFWLDTRDQDERGAPREIDLFLRLLVTRPQGADADGRVAGVVTKQLGSSQRQLHRGVFACRKDSGEEEWQVRLCLHASSPGVVPFHAWYDDGRGGVSYDDNAGQLHLVRWKEGFEVVRHDFEATTISLTDAGVAGTLSVLLADLEYNKEVGLVWTTDGWKTHQEFGTGGASINQWHWVRDAFEGFQQWQIDLELPGSFEAFEYAIVYRHGNVPGAEKYEFWADNGHRNFVVRRTHGSRP